ncbi:hypothetical protein NDU88_006247 [Pleurodeles waltl]|uniref:Reverse transcriptase domain-containing protein n=1 Tax=Pleurodeles waltl TaxID=8319 RepID=A0AAV7VM94_PLEWA|nr:hypothetical protein NDU88_006247 [Pleurodeles waltl]
MGDADYMELLRDIRFSELEEESRVALEGDLTMEAIKQAMHGLQSGMGMDPNGIPIKMNKVMANKVAPYLRAMFQATLHDGILPEDQRIATIVVIHKAGKPQTSSSSHRPSSLLNMETKILAKVLASMLQAVITSLIHPDQSGFMPPRGTKLNHRRLYGAPHIKWVSDLN